MTDAEKVRLAARILRTAFEADPELGGMVAYMDAVYDILTFEEDEE